MLPYVKTTDRNQAVLLGLPDLLPRMVKLVVNRVPMARWEDEMLTDLPEGQYHELLSLLGAWILLPHPSPDLFPLSE